MSDLVSLAAGAAGALLGSGEGWLRRLRLASFRGVPFHFERVTHKYGRRHAMHEYPGRDMPWAEPLGRRQRIWTIDAYVIGDAFHLAREALRRACEDEEEEGTLILPIVGRVLAVCNSFEFDDSRQQGRYSALSLEFAESGQRQFPAGIEDTRSAIGTSAGELGSVEHDTFLGGFNVGSPAGAIAPFRIAVTDAATSTLAGAAAANVVAFGEQLDALRLSTVEDQAPLVEAIEVMTRQADFLVHDPPKLFEAVDTAFAAYTDAMPADTVFLGMLTLASTYEAQQAPEIVAEWSPSSPELREAETRNALLFQGLVRRLALREMGYALPGIDLDNTERAELIRDQIFEAFLAESDDAAAARDDAAFRALTDLAHRLLDDLDHRAAQLPALTTYRTGRSINAITLAYQLYADAERNLDLVDRVGVITPAFMPLTGRVLER